MDTGSSAIASRWARFRFDFVGPFVRLRYRDSQTDQVRFSHSFLYGNWTPTHLDAIAQRFRSLLGPLINRVGPHATGPAPVALYYSFPDGVPLLELREQFFRWLSTAFPLELFQPVQLDPAPKVQRDPFALPFRVLADRTMDPFLTRLRSEWWVASQDTPDLGFRIEKLDGDLELTLRVNGCSVLLAGNADDALGVIRHLPLEQRPRLVVAAGNASVPPPGVALLSLRLNANIEPMLFDFFLGLVHDYPIHEALKGALRHWDATPDLSLSAPTMALTANPFTNQSLRLRDALIALKRLGDRIRLYSLPQPQLGLPSAGGSPADLGNLVREIRGMHPETDFRQESSGLGPLSNRTSRARRLERDRFQNAVTREVFEPSAPRAVDVALLRLDTEPWYEPVDQTHPLLSGASYDIRIHIGPTLEETLVSGPVRPIDLLLGPPDTEQGHALQLSIHGKDFEVSGPTLQWVTLPVRGPSEPRYFQIRAPNRTMTEAQLRILIYHRNHLVQSFLLSATVDTHDKPGKVEVREEFSQTDDFGNLDALGERAVSFGLNEGPGHSHQIKVVSDNVDGTVEMKALAFSNTVEEVRKALRTGLLIGGAARVYHPVPPGGRPDPTAATAFYELAKIGNSAYKGMLRDLDGEIYEAVVGLQSAWKKPVQIIRFDTHAVFPWTVLYDWPLPDHSHSAPEPSICLGQKPDGSPCGHDKDSKVVCVHGFWGVRLLVEEMLKPQRNAKGKLTKPAKDPLWVVCSSGLVQGKTVASALAKMAETGIRQGPWTEAGILDLLWKAPSERPAILIMLGHLQKASVDMEREGDRVELVPGAEWFTLKGLGDRAIRSRWDNPRTVVVLAMCGSAGTTPETLNDFVAEFSGAGAGAIVGTHIDVGESLATSFAERFTMEFWEHPLGEAMHRVRSRFVREGHPGGFLFQSFGDVDLRLQ